jgi:hypothetical protein
MSSKTPRIRDQKSKPFAFISRAQMLEAKSRRLARELKIWLDNGASLEDKKALDIQQVLIQEIVNLEPQCAFTEDMVVPAVVTFCFEHPQHNVEIWGVAIAASPNISADGDMYVSRWYIAPSVQPDPITGYAWPELLRLIGTRGLATLEVIL